MTRISTIGADQLLVAVSERLRTRSRGTAGGARRRCCDLPKKAAASSSTRPKKAERAKAVLGEADSHVR